MSQWLCLSLVYRINENNEMQNRFQDLKNNQDSE